jgi:hypothetical protein
MGVGRVGIKGVIKGCWGWEGWGSGGGRGWGAGGGRGGDLGVGGMMEGWIKRC